MAAAETRTGGGAAAAGATGLAAGTTTMVAGAATGPGEAVAAPAGAAIDLGSAGLLAGGSAMTAHGLYAGGKAANLLADDAKNAATGNGPDAKPIDSTRPQHGNEEHDATAYNDALQKQNTPGNSDARFNQQLTDTKGNAIPGFKPDSQATRTLPDGSQVRDVTEVRSPGQSDEFMNNKVAAMKQALGNQAGDVKWIEPTQGARRNAPPPPPIPTKPTSSD